MQTVINDLETRMQAAVDLLAREFAGVRTGRASTALLDNLRVEAYGNLTPLNQLASLSVPDPKTLVIQPWDASQIGNIEKAIHKSDLGITPSSDGKVLRLVMPTLTEERRKQLAKTVGKYAEEKLKTMAKDKHVSQDDERRGHDTIQKTTDKFTAKVDELAKKKEQEILSM
jgi:ribosome recycling factor